MDQEEEGRQSSAHVAEPLPQLGDNLDWIAAQVQELARAHERIQALLDAVLAVSRELELPSVLRRIVTTAMDLVDARYGALGVLNEQGDGLAEFIPVGLSDQQVAALAGAGFPRGRGVLGRLMRHPEPLRVDDIPAHPESAGFPRGHPRMRTLLGVAISVRGRIYGNLYLSERRDKQPFDDRDEAIVVALAGAAGVAVENARLFAQVRAGAEQFQRLLLPRLPDLAPFSAAAVYRAATEQELLAGKVGGDWYDIVPLPDGAIGAVIGDVVGHDLIAAAAMAQTRNMLRALLYNRNIPPSAVLAQLDQTLHAITENPVTTACLACIEPTGQAWRMRWSTAGHLPPLLLTPDGQARYLHADPGVPLGVDTGLPRPDHTHPLPAHSTVVLFTDGLVEHHDHPLERGLDTLAALAADHADQPLERLCQTLVDHNPGDGHDDLAILALRTPDRA
jgi:serine phosphatase RsbU (regulator of sigma subunit)